MILIWYQGRRLRVLPWSSTNLWWLWIEIREAAGTEVITLTMRKWLSRAPEKSSQFLSPSEGGQPEVGGDISAQGCRVRHKMNQGNSISSLIWITALNLCLSCSQSLAPSSGNIAIRLGSPYSISFGEIHLVHRDNCQQDTTFCTSPKGWSSLWEPRDSVILFILGTNWTWHLHLISECIRPQFSPLTMGLPDSEQDS